MNHTCSHRSAVGEAAGMCCSGDKIKLLDLQLPPKSLESLKSETTDKSKHFLENIMKYNSCFQMMSFDATNELCESGFMCTFKVQAQVLRRVGSLLLLLNEECRLLQVYFIGEKQKAVSHRCDNIRGIRRDIVLELQGMFRQRNNHVHMLKTALQRMPSDAYWGIVRADKKPAERHARCFNEPVTNEVAVFVVSNEFDRRDSILKRMNSQLEKVAETHRSYDLLQYPLIFWEGEDSHHFNIMQVNPRAGTPVNEKKVSAMGFYACRIIM